MFSRRHPYLFFFLLFTTIVATAVIILSFLIFWGTRRPQFEFGEKVGVIEIKGVITDAIPILSSIKKFREDESVKAIVLRIDSPGGSVGPSQEVYREIRKTIAKKTIITSMGTIAASGGYYIAAATNGIVASPGTVTGSIGVVVGFANMEKLLKKIGLFPVVVKSGEYKDTGAPHRQMTEDEKRLLQDFVDQIQKQFVAAISKGRKMAPAKIEAIADGRIFCGETAKALGLVDRMGNLEDAIEWAGRLGGIKGKISAIYAQEERFSLIRQLIDSSFKTLLNHAAEPALYGGYLYIPAAQ